MIDSEKKKQRGQRRRLERMFSYIDEFPETAFSRRFDKDNKSEKLLVPSGEFIESHKTYPEVKTAFCRKWAETAEKIYDSKPDDIPFCKVTAMILPDGLWYSQIIIFYDKEYYDNFFDRNETYEDGCSLLWFPDNTGHSFCRERNIKTSLTEKIYIQKLTYKNRSGDTENSESGIIFLGDVL